ncbi:MAG: WecB/TagA/CpsF family glycosyltransferase [Pseudomonadota bacterium]
MIPSPSLSTHDTVIEPHLNRERFLSMGIPVDNVSPGQAIQRILHMINQFKVDQRARLVATLNVDFVVNAQGLLYRRPKHPELLQILRSADMVTADGFPIVLLGKIAGSQIESRVTGADLVPALAKTFARTGNSMYLLGGAADSANVAANRLVHENPDLTIAGVSSPMIAIEGEGLLTSIQQDQKIVDEINQSEADVLLLGLGNPKQELWFQRNRHRLKVPVTIGVGGTFEFIAGNVRRAPLWVQKSNLEWVYRITQDPKRLLKRYFVGLLKFGLLLLPLLLMRFKYQHQRIECGNSANVAWKIIWGSRTQIIRTTVAPENVTYEWLSRLETSMHQDESSLLFIDCSSVRRIELAGHQMFYDLGQRFKRGRHKGALIGLSQRVQRSLKVSRALDGFDERVLNQSPSDMMTHNQNANSDLSCQSFLLEKSTLIFLNGQADRQSLQKTAIVESINDILSKRDCIVDLRYLVYIDAGAIIDLYQVASKLESAGHQLFLSGLSADLVRSIELMKLPTPFNIVEDGFFSNILCNSIGQVQ